MAEEIQGNIEDSGINLEEKFRNGGDSESVVEQENQMESVENQEGVDKSYEKILSKVEQSEKGVDENSVMQDASDLHKQADRESQMQHLLDIASTKGVVHAVKVAQKTQDYYGLDTLHDKLLSDELHEKLLSKGMIKSD